MIKRSFDFFFSFFGLLVLSPILLVISSIVWISDKETPFYRAKRAGRSGKTFMLTKFRSMTVGSDKSGVDSTSENDSRITPIGAILRKYKLDELPQLWNVFVGSMSLVGPRPQIPWYVDNVYTELERSVLSVRPGITDISSLVFSDEGEILADIGGDPNTAYDKYIRPWKSRLALLYVRNQSIYLDIQLIFLTITAIFNKPFAMRTLQKILVSYNIDEELLSIVKRDGSLLAGRPPK